MALSAVNLLQPAGKLEAALFPGVGSAELEERLTAYLVAGAAKATALGVLAPDVETAALAWGYYRAYHNIYLRLLTTPREAHNEAQGGRTYEQEQADGYLALANQALAEFEDVVPVESAAAPAVVPSASFRHRNVW